MGATGYVALKIRGKKRLYYVDWTNTRREYDLNNLDSSEIEDLRRLFTSDTIILVPSKSKTISILNKRLGSMDCSRVLGVCSGSSLPKILFSHLSSNGIPGGFYNHRRGAFLSIISTLNLHLLIHGMLSNSTTMLIINQTLKKYWKKTKAKVVFDGFIRIGLIRQVDILLPSSKGGGSYFTF